MTNIFVFWKYDILVLNADINIDLTIKMVQHNNALHKQLILNLKVNRISQRQFSFQSSNY